MSAWFSVLSADGSSAKLKFFKRGEGVAEENSVQVLEQKLITLLTKNFGWKFE